MPALLAAAALYVALLVGFCWLWDRVERPPWRIPQ
jgi:hypothetical protein